MFRLNVLFTRIKFFKYMENCVPTKLGFRLTETERKTFRLHVDVMLGSQRNGHSLLISSVVSFCVSSRQVLHITNPLGNIFCVQILLKSDLGRWE